MAIAAPILQPGFAAPALTSGRAVPIPVPSHRRGAASPTRLPQSRYERWPVRPRVEESEKRLRPGQHASAGRAACEASTSGGGAPRESENSLFAYRAIEQKTNRLRSTCARSRRGLILLAFQRIFAGCAVCRRPFTSLQGGSDQA